MPTLAVALTGLGIGAAITVAILTYSSVSPREAAASRAAPVLPVAVAAVERQTLVDETLVPCTPKPPIVTVAPPVLPPGTPAVVTRVGPDVGQPVTTGTVLAVVSGQPVVAFVSSIPLYRDLAGGDSGPDVSALQQGLVSTGALPSATGTMDQATIAALDQIYASADIPSPDLAGRVRLANSVTIPGPSTVDSVDIAAGTVLTDPTLPMLTLRGQGSELSCLVPAALDITGKELALAGADGARLAVTVRSVAPVEAAQPEREVVVAPSPDADPAAAPFDLVIVNRRSAGAVLVVPARALWDAPGGGVEVRVTTADAVTVVPVRVGMASGGLVEVDADGLADGDEVQLRATS